MSRYFRHDSATLARSNFPKARGSSGLMQSESFSRSGRVFVRCNGPLDRMNGGNYDKTSSRVGCSKIHLDEKNHY